jgi:ferredoxin
VLSDPEQRMVYDEINGYALTSSNPFLNSAQECDHVFVDEFTCIGCKNCANTAPDTFAIEEEFGRARVVSQLGDPTLAQSAVETCPVDCIHRVTAAQLTLLEDEMRRIERVNVCPPFLAFGVMNSLNSPVCLQY